MTLSYRRIVPGVTHVFPLLPRQLVAARYPDSPPHTAGDSGLHADAVRHVLQHLDLPWGHCGLSSRLFHLIPSRGSDLMVRTVKTEHSFFLALKGSHVLET